MGYFLAAALGALFVVVVQLILRGRHLAAHRRRPGPEQSFRRYSGLIVPDERGTTEVDEIFVTPAGVFVVEKKDFGAWIYGNEDDEDWTAVYPNREKYSFQNPIRQNYRHIKALESFLRTTRSVFSSIVVFSPRSRFMTALPPHVLTSDHVGFVRSRGDVVLSPEEFDRICANLDTLKATSDIDSFDRHVNQLHERFESTTHCPRCNGHLVRRRSRKPGDEQNVFLGCSNFPACRYVRNLETT
jgi:restriction system protein